MFSCSTNNNDCSSLTNEFTKISKTSQVCPKFLQRRCHWIVDTYSFFHVEVNRFLCIVDPCIFCVGIVSICTVDSCIFVYCKYIYSRSLYLEELCVSILDPCACAVLMSLFFQVYFIGRIFQTNSFV